MAAMAVGAAGPAAARAPVSGCRAGQSRVAQPAGRFLTRCSLPKRAQGAGSGCSPPAIEASATARASWAPVPESTDARSNAPLRPLSSQLDRHGGPSQPASQPASQPSLSSATHHAASSTPAGAAPAPPSSAGAAPGTSASISCCSERSASLSAAGMDSSISWPLRISRS
jgi:hypothetical protein